MLLHTAVVAVSGGRLISINLKLLYIAPHVCNRLTLELKGGELIGLQLASFVSAAIT